MKALPIALNAVVLSVYEELKDLPPSKAAIESQRIISALYSELRAMFGMDETASAESWQKVAEHAKGLNDIVKDWGEQNG